MKNMSLRRIWTRRATIAKRVELLELGRAGGVHNKRKRTAGAMRQACLGGGQRCVAAEVSEAFAAQEGGVILLLCHINIMSLQFCDI